MSSTRFLELLIADEASGCKRFAYDANRNIIYKGFHAQVEAGTAAPGYKIWKFTYNGNNDIVWIQGPRVGKWDDRATLDW